MSEQSTQMPTRHSASALECLVSHQSKYLAPTKTSPRTTRAHDLPKDWSMLDSRPSGIKLMTSWEAKEAEVAAVAHL